MWDWTNSRSYNVTGLLYILGQSLTFFSIVTDEDLRGRIVNIISVFLCYMIAHNNLSSPTYAVAMSLYQIIEGLCGLFILKSVD